MNKYPTLKRNHQRVLLLLTKHGFEPVGSLDLPVLEKQLRDLEEWNNVLTELDKLLREI